MAATQENPSKQKNRKEQEMDKDSKLLKAIITAHEAEELPYRRLSFYAYLFVLLAVGLPIWWFTTTPYRASLDNFNADTIIRIPISVRIYYSHTAMRDVLEKISVKWTQDKESPFEYPTPLRITYTFVVEFKENLIDFIRRPSLTTGCDVEIVLLDVEEFTMLKLNDKDEILMTNNRFILSASESLPKLYDYIRRVIFEEVLDIKRLSVIMQREYKVEHEQSKTEFMKPEIAVWEDISISPNYNVHVIFVHDEPDVQPRDRAVEVEIIDTINRLANLLVDTTLISVGCEHFWDFGLSNFVKQNKDFFLHVPFGSVSDFVTEVDRYSAAIETPDPTFKLVVVFSNKGISMVDEENQPVNSLAVASWGGILCIAPNSSKDPNIAVLDVLRSLLGVRTTLSSGFTRLNYAISDLGWQRLQLHAYVENQLKARHYVKAIHQLTSKISDLVISDEVAGLVKSAIEASFNKNLDAKCVDVFSSAKARIFAEKAANHPSLLEYLNFPWGQKYAIYLPLFFPVLLPILEEAKAMIQSWRERRKQKID